jgi:hypothetical protein
MRYLEIINKAGQKYYIGHYYPTNKYLRKDSDLNNIFLSEADF